MFGTAYRRGVAAYKAGKTTSDNPYDRYADADNHANWERGFWTAMAEGLPRKTKK